MWSPLVFALRGGRVSSGETFRDPGLDMGRSRFSPGLETQYVGFASDKEKKTLWKCPTLEILWVIWLERNDMVFNGRRVDRALLWEEWSFWHLFWRGPRELSLGSLWWTFRGMIGRLFHCLDSFVCPFNVDCISLFFCSQGDSSSSLMCLSFFR